MIELDKNARDILKLWKERFGFEEGANIDYSEAIRKAQESLDSIDDEDKKSSFDFDASSRGVKKEG
jgi:hypothetical protein